jgi:hypothetical protein
MADEDVGAGSAEAPYPPYAGVKLTVDPKLVRITGEIRSGRRREHVIPGSNGNKEIGSNGLST